MRPSMPTTTKSGREALRLRFSEAAKSVTELYRDAVFSYDVGYRDALLYVHRYIVLVAPAAAAANSIMTTAAATNTTSSPSPSSSPHGGQPHPREVFTPSSSSRFIDVEGLLLFIQNTLKRRDAMTAASRGTSRRRKRSSSRVERATRVLRPEESFDFSGNGALQDDDRDTLYRRRRLHTPFRGAEEPTDILPLREVHISRVAESDSGTSEDDCGEEM